MADNEDPGWKVKVASWVWENANEIAQRLERVYHWFRPAQMDGTTTEQRPGILILGPGGAGKTTLARLLSGRVDILLDSLERYAESLDVETYELAESPGVELVVPPGQMHRRDATWSGLQGQLAAGRFRGVILLAPFGYHSLGEISYKSHPLFKGKTDEFVAAYLDARRKEELGVLRQLAPYLEASKGKLWVLTVVAKEDLWWPDRIQVHQHYLQGDYEAAIRGVVQSRGKDSFRHEFAFGSLIIRNFATGKGEILKPNAQGYDQEEQIRSLRRLIEIVDALREWEGAR